MSKELLHHFQSKQPSVEAFKKAMSMTDKFVVGGQTPTTALAPEHRGAREEKLKELALVKQTLLAEE